jgi:Tfp pilus assembly protein PilF
MTIIVTKDAPSAEQVLQTAKARLAAGAPQAALALLDQARQQQPDHPEILFQMANIFRDLQQPAPATLLYQQLAMLRPKDVAVLNNLANLLHEQNRLDEAAQAITAALAVRQDVPELWVTQATIAEVRGDHVEAEENLRRALVLKHDHATALANLAALLSDRGDYVGAISLRDQAQKYLGDRPRLLVAQANDYFRQGNFAAAWPLYEHRFHAAPGEAAMVTARPFKQPCWRGEALGNHALLIWFEQGIGEQLMAASMLADALQHTRHILVECEGRLIPLLARSFPTIQFVARAEPPAAICLAPDIAAQISGLGLGEILRPEITKFTQHHGFITADPALREKLRQRYQQSAAGKKLVGISWRSKPYKYSDPKSSALSDWQDLLRLPHLCCINLQYGDCAAELAWCRAQGIEVLHDPAIDPLQDLDAFAAQVAACDQVVTVSNATAHFAGALGVPADVLIPYGRAAPPHWLANRSNSPWYSSLRLARQHSPGAWRPLLQKISENFVNS